jgi:hypothetical protein
MDNALHALFCPALGTQRAEHNVDEYINSFGATYFFSLPFLEFAAHIYSIPQISTIRPTTTTTAVHD